MRNCFICGLILLILTACDVTTSKAHKDVGDKSLAVDASLPTQANSVEDQGTLANSMPPKATLPSNSQIPDCKQQPLATYLFTLVEKNRSVDDCGKFNPRVAKAFSELLSGASRSKNPPLRARLLSGPEPVGERVIVDSQERWFYMACQAHQCSTTFLSALYDASAGRMVGRLINRCNTQWLGNPSLREQTWIESEHPVDMSSFEQNPDCIEGQK
jgi:hypothetical protein